MTSRRAGLLILIKHSLPEIDPNLPASEWRLSGLGRERAGLLAEALRPYRPAVIYSSRERKAVETAEIISEGLAVKRRVLKDLHEHDRRDAGFLEGEDFERAIRKFFARPTELVYGRETAAQARARFTRAVHALIESNPRRTLAAVSHGTVISLFAADLLGVSPFELWKGLALPSFLVLDLAAKRLLARQDLDERS